MRKLRMTARKSWIGRRKTLPRRPVRHLRRCSAISMIRLDVLRNDSIRQKLTSPRQSVKLRRLRPRTRRRR